MGTQRLDNTAEQGSLTKKRNLDRDDHEDWESSRDGSRSPPRSRSCRESDRNSTGSQEHDFTKRHRFLEAMDINSPSSRDIAFRQYPHAMETDSPSSYPKHVIVPSPPDSNDRKADTHSRPPFPTYPRNYYVGESPIANMPHEKVVTPILADRHVGIHGGYEGRYMYPGRQQGHYYPSDAYGHPYHAAQQMPFDGPYNQHQGSHEQVQLRPKRWACDYCCVATFPTYEDACAHEESCSRNAHSMGRHNHAHPHHPYPSQPQYQGEENPQGIVNSGLGALYQATQEVQHRVPPLPINDHSGYRQITPRFQQYSQHGREQEHARHYHNPRRILLAGPNDVESLSDRQCFVRSDFVEVFAATEKDVSSRHSKGAQKLVRGQVGIRCIHCSHLRPKDRAERAVCYPSSISRIYQTVADMQRFHFEQCREIPDQIRQIYKNLKTTRPRGVGSPQTYWIQSAKLLGMVDSEDGICFDSGPHKSDD